jgi:hypothetical protein
MTVIKNEMTGNIKAMSHFNNPQYRRALESMSEDMRNEYISAGRHMYENIDFDSGPFAPQIHWETAGKTPDGVISHTSASSAENAIISKKDESKEEE